MFCQFARILLTKTVKVFPKDLTCFNIKLHKYLNLFCNKLNSQYLCTMPPKRKLETTTMNVVESKETIKSKSKSKSATVVPNEEIKEKRTKKTDKETNNSEPKIEKNTKKQPKESNESESKKTNEKRTKKSKESNNLETETEPEPAKMNGKRTRKQEKESNEKSNNLETAESSKTNEKRTRKQQKETNDSETEVKKSTAKRTKKQETEAKSSKTKEKNTKKQQKESNESESESETKKTSSKVSKRKLEKETEKAIEKRTTKEKEVEVKKGTKSKKKIEPESEPEEEEKEKPKKAVKKTKKDDPKKEPVKNKTSTSYESIDFNCTKKNSSGQNWNFKISNWNVDGIRAWFTKGGLEFFKHENPDVLCLQETKCNLTKLPKEVKELEGYKVYFQCSEKDGYAGVGLYTKTEPISVKYGLGDDEFDNEGRMITAELDKFYVISVYVPNSGRGLVTLPKRLKWNERFREYVADLNKSKPVIICGDMNVAHSEIDLANPKGNTKNAGFTKEERDGMTEFLSDGYVDTFRKLYPDRTDAYTFWSYMANSRSKNIGWRLDYFIVPDNFMNHVCDNVIRSEVFGSDHCPLTLFLHI